MWACQRSGDCCRDVKIVTMTHAERRVVAAAADRLGLRLHWRAGDRPSFTNLVARPCPFFSEDEKACRIHSERPYNCRRFMCGRSDLSESYRQGGIVSGVPMRVLKSAELHADYAALQRESQAWAEAHGWSASCR